MGDIRLQSIVFSGNSIQIIIEIPFHSSILLPVCHIQPLQQDGRAHTVANDMVAIHKQIPHAVPAGPQRRSEQRCGGQIKGTEELPACRLEILGIQHFQPEIHLIQNECGNALGILAENRAENGVLGDQGGKCCLQCRHIRLFFHPEGTGHMVSVAIRVQNRLHIHTLLHSCQGISGLFFLLQQHQFLVSLGNIHRQFLTGQISRQLGCSAVGIQICHTDSSCQFLLNQQDTLHRIQGVAAAEEIVAVGVDLFRTQHGLENIQHRLRLGRHIAGPILLR